MKNLIAVILVISGWISSANAQQPAPENDSLKVVDILNADRFSFKKIDSVTEFQTMAGNVRLKQGNTYFSADSAAINRRTKVLEAFGNIHINDNDSVHTYSQYLLYYADKRIAILKKKVKLTDNTSQLFTEELEYDLNQKIGIYRNGGRVVNKTSVLTSREATYYAELKDVYFKQNVKLKDPAYDLETDSLLYNTNTQLATFISRTVIKDSTRNIVTSDGYYDMKNKNAFFGKRPVIKDGAVTIIANEVETDDNTGISKLIGSAVFKDTSQGISIIANYIESNKLKGSFFATENPLMILKQDQDSIYVTGDTLFSGILEKPVDSIANRNVPDSMVVANIQDSSKLDSTGLAEISVIRDENVLQNPIAIRDTIKGRNVVDLNKNDSTYRFFQVYRNVRIFSDSLQAVCDSLYYNEIDSVFQLFKDPIVWASGSQVTGDTILLYTKDKKADRMLVYENGLLVNKTGENMFNQIRGNRINGTFVDGNIDNMRAKGNAESIYYAMDEEDNLVGINRASGDIIDMRFRNKELYEVVFISEVKGTMYPARQMPEAEKSLRGFQWQEQKRPKTKYELFGD
ncbi:MAG: OstA-like protein [Flavitalea sp.]